MWILIVGVFTATHLIASDVKMLKTSSNLGRTLSSQNVIEFNFQKHCRCCGCVVKYTGKKKRHPCTNIRFPTFIERICNERNNALASQIRELLQFVHNLPAADAVYHRSCCV